MYFIPDFDETLGYYEAADGVHIRSLKSTPAANDRLLSGMNTGAISWTDCFPGKQLGHIDRVSEETIREMSPLIFQFYLALQITAKVI
jgi:hypothetical protein